MSLDLYHDINRVTFSMEQTTNQHGTKPVNSDVIHIKQVVVNSLGLYQACHTL